MTNLCDVCGKPATQSMLRDLFGKSNEMRFVCSDHGFRIRDPADVAEIERLRAKLGSIRARCLNLAQWIDKGCDPKHGATEASFIALFAKEPSDEPGVCAHEWEVTEQPFLDRCKKCGTTGYNRLAPSLTHNTDVRREINGKDDVPDSQYAGILEAAEAGDPVNSGDLINALWWRLRNQRREIARLQKKSQGASRDASPCDCGSAIHKKDCPYVR